MELLKKPSAWIPIVIPLALFAYIVAVLYANEFVVVREEDEGVGAHLFQLWLVLEPFLLGYFAIKWVPRAGRQALLVLALQLLAAFLAVGTVFLLKL